MKKKEICIPSACSGWSFDGITIILAQVYNPKTNKVSLDPSGCGILPQPQVVSYANIAGCKSEIEQIIKDIFKDGNPLQE